jgi:hypothetical protein
MGFDAAFQSSANTNCRSRSGSSVLFNSITANPAQSLFTANLASEKP